MRHMQFSKSKIVQQHHSCQRKPHRPRTICRQAQDWQFPGRTRRARENECAIWNAWAYIVASGANPTEAMVSRLTGRGRHFVRLILRRLAGAGLMTKEKPVYRSNRLQHVPRTMNWHSLRTARREPVRTSTGEPVRPKALGSKSFETSSDTHDTPAREPRPRVRATELPSNPEQQPQRQPRPVEETPKPKTIEETMCAAIRALQYGPQALSHGEAIRAALWVAYRALRAHGGLPNVTRYYVRGVDNLRWQRYWDRPFLDEAPERFLRECGRLGFGASGLEFVAQLEQELHETCKKQFAGYSHLGQARVEKFATGAAKLFPGGWLNVLALGEFKAAVREGQRETSKQSLPEGARLTVDLEPVAVRTWEQARKYGVTWDRELFAAAVRRAAESCGFSPAR